MLCSGKPLNSLTDKSKVYSLVMVLLLREHSSKDKVFSSFDSYNDSGMASQLVLPLGTEQPPNFFSFPGPALAMVSDIRITEKELQHELFYVFPNYT